MTHLVLKRLTVLPFVYDSFGEDVIMWVCLVLDDLNGTLNKDRPMLKLPKFTHNPDPCTFHDGTMDSSCFHVATRSWAFPLALLRSFERVTSNMALPSSKWIHPDTLLHVSLQILG